MARYDASAHESFGIISEDIKLMNEAAKKIKGLAESFLSAIIVEDRKEQEVYLNAIASEGYKLDVIAKKISRDAENAAASIGIGNPTQLGMFDPETGEVIE